MPALRGGHLPLFDKRGTELFSRDYQGATEKELNSPQSQSLPGVAQHHRCCLQPVLLETHLAPRGLHRRASSTAHSQASQGWLAEAARGLEGAERLSAR